jgi:hypothetical protein
MTEMTEALLVIVGVVNAFLATNIGVAFMLWIGVHYIIKNAIVSALKTSKKEGVFEHE